MLLIGGLLAIIATALLLRKRWLAASIVTVLILLAVSAAVVPLQPRGLTARFELVVRAGDLLETNHLPVAPPLRRQRWQCVAAYRRGQFEIPVRQSHAATDRAGCPQPA